MQDLRFYRPTLRLIERAFSPYSKNIRAVLTLIIILTSIRHAGKALLFFGTGALSLSLAVLRLAVEKGGDVSLHTFGAVFIIGIVLLGAAWFIAAFNATHRFKVDYSFTAGKILPFFGFLNIFIFYAIIGGRTWMYVAAAFFALSVFIYYKEVFFKEMNYQGKEFIFWNLYPVPPDELFFPVEDTDRLKKYKITLQDDTRNAIVSPGDSGLLSMPIKISNGDRLIFSIGLAEKAFRGEYRFEIYASLERAHKEKIFSHHLNPTSKAVDRTWKEFQIDLTPYGGEELALYFATCFKGGHQRIDGYWEFPKIINRTTALPVPSSGRNAENVIILVIDGMRADLFQCTVQAADGIRNILNFFSRNSIHCKQAIAQNDWTIPAFASIFSGQYSVQHQHFVSHPLRYQRAIPHDIGWLPKILRDEGYLTCAFSGYSGINPGYGFAKGFDRFYNGENLEEIDHGEKVSLYGLRFLKENESRKKFLFLHYFTTHRPFVTRRPYRVSRNPNFTNWFNGESMDSFLRTPYERLNEEDKEAIIDIYSTAIAQVDRELSIIFDYLIASGEADRAMVILTTDHGYPLFDRNGFSTKVTALYEEIIRIPFFIRMHEDALKSESPIVIEGPIEANVDIFPTVLDAVGFKGKVSSDGRSIFKVLKGEMPFKDYTISELYDTKSDTYMLAIRKERYKLIATYNFDASMPFTFKTAKKVKEAFFDLLNDPNEEKDISREQQDIFLEYREIEERFSGLSANK